MSWVAILMGSENDWPIMEAAWTVLTDLGVETEVRVTSAHRTPEATASYVQDAQERDCGVFICGAGMAAHLAGAVAAQTVRPVIGVPVNSGPLNGADALLSTVQMPGGIPVATVAIGKAGAKNAGYLAAQMLGLADGPLFTRLQQDRKDNQSKIERQNKKLQATLKQATS